MIDIHPTVPNPYTLLRSLLQCCQWYTVLDLKDSFFSFSLTLKSQPYFAFEWYGPEIEASIQLTWTILSQGFKTSPTIFDEALQEDLGEYWTPYPDVCLLQYVDDFLVATADQEIHLTIIEWLLQVLGGLGYHAPAKIY